MRDGISPKRLVSLERRTGWTRSQVAGATGLKLRTLQRRVAEGRLTSDQSDRLLRLERVLEQAVALFDGDQAAACRWLSTPLPALAGERPLDYTATEVGAREVEDLIGRLEHGVFS